MDPKTNIRMRKRKQKKLSQKCNDAYAIVLDNASLHGVSYGSGENVNEQDYLAAKEQLEAEYREASKVVADYKRKLEVIEAAWAIYQDLAKKHGKPKSESRPVISDLVRAVLPTVGEKFKKYQILAAIEKKFPEYKGTFRISSLAGTLNRMCKRGELEVVERGKGPEGFVYKRGTN
jgi:hypothetical protein